MKNSSLFNKISVIWQKEDFNTIFRLFLANTKRSSIFCLKYIICFILISCFISNLEGVLFTKKIFYAVFFTGLTAIFPILCIVDCSIYIFTSLPLQNGFKNLSFHHKIFVYVFSYSFLIIFMGHPNIGLYSFANIFIAHILNFLFGFVFYSFFIIVYKLYEERKNPEYYNIDKNSEIFVSGKGVASWNPSFEKLVSNEHKNMFYEKHDLYKGIAYHEAGHVAMTILQNLTVERVCFNFSFENQQALGGTQTLGYAQQTATIDFTATIEKCIEQIKINLAGSIANKIYCKKEKIDYHLTGNIGDFNTANMLAVKIVEENGYSTKYENLNISGLPDKEKYKLEFLQEQQTETYNILNENWELVEKLATELLNSKEGLLEKEDINKIYKEYLHNKNSLN